MERKDIQILTSNEAAVEDAALAVAVGQRLAQTGLTLAFAESCTGGLTSSLITDVAGSSVYFLGAAVTYSNSAKEHVLGVSPTTLMTEGAVSAQAAREMAQGARRLFGADLAVAITGIAGPTGGTAVKPVGLVFIHLSAPGAEWAEQCVWTSDRIGNKHLSAVAALRLVWRYLEAMHAT